MSRHRGRSKWCPSFKGPKCPMYHLNPIKNSGVQLFYGIHSWVGIQASFFKLPHKNSREDFDQVILQDATGPPRPIHMFGYASLGVL